MEKRNRLKSEIGNRLGKGVLMKPTIYVYDTAAAGGTDFAEIGQVTTYKDFIPVPHWNAPGSFTIVINRSVLGAGYFKADRIIKTEDGFVGYIDGIEDKQQSNRANAFITVTGTELKDQLFRVTLPPEGQDTDNYTGQHVETIAKALINKNAAASAAEVRRIAGLALATDQERGSVINFSTRHKELLSELYTLLAADRLGLVCEYDPDTETITYDVAEGVDRTQGQDANSQVIISVDWKTATEYTRKQDQSAYRNVAITAGQGEGKDRTIVLVGDTDNTGYARREMFVDARDVEDDSELPDRGTQKLTEAQKVTGVTVTFNNNGAFKIGEDFVVGDFVTAMHTDVDGNDVADDLQVISAAYKYSADIGYPDISLVLDYDPDDISRVISNKLSKYNSLLASEAPVADVTGPASSVNGNIAAFDGITGKALKDSGVPVLGLKREYLTLLKTSSANMTTFPGTITFDDAEAINGTALIERDGSKISCKANCYIKLEIEMGLYNLAAGIAIAINIYDDSDNVYMYQRIADLNTRYACNFSTKVIAANAGDKFRVDITSSDTDIDVYSSTRTEFRAEAWAR